MTEIVGTLREALEPHREIVAAYLFGSAAKGCLRDDSDVDVAVLLGGSRPAAEEARYTTDLGAELTGKLGREADVVVLDRAPLLLRYSVYRFGVPIIERDPGAAHLFKARSLSLWFDFEPAHTRACRASLAHFGVRPRG